MKAQNTEDRQPGLMRRLLDRTAAALDALLGGSQELPQSGWVVSGGGWPVTPLGEEYRRAALASDYAYEGDTDPAEVAAMAQRLEDTPTEEA